MKYINKKHKIDYENGLWIDTQKCAVNKELINSVLYTNFPLRKNAHEA